MKASKKYKELRERLNKKVKLPKKKGQMVEIRDEERIYNLNNTNNTVKF